jgi:hypothetical protein
MPTRAPAPATPIVDRLDVPVRLLPARLWAGFAAFAALVLAAVVWAVAATLPEHVSAGGVTLNGGSLVAARAPAAGSLASVSVSAGTRVTRGEPIGALSQGARVVPVRAPVTGTVATLLAVPGQQLESGAPLADIDQTAQPPRAVMFVTSVRDLAQLAPGDTVEVTGATVARGRVLSITPYPASADDLVARFGTTQVPGLHLAGKPVWLVDVGLSSRGPAPPALAPISATVLVGHQHPYQLVFGGGSSR